MKLPLLTAPTPPSIATSATSRLKGNPWNCFVPSEAALPQLKHRLISTNYLRNWTVEKAHMDWTPTFPYITIMTNQIHVHLSPMFIQSVPHLPPSLTSQRLSLGPVEEPNLLKQSQSNNISYLHKPFSQLFLHFFCLQWNQAVFQVYIFPWGHQNQVPFFFLTPHSRTWGWCVISSSFRPWPLRNKSPPDCTAPSTWYCWAPVNLARHSFTD